MLKTFVNHYEILCVASSATQEEIRRAYRILARRYHPDVNPGKASEEKFKAIAEAYSVLTDSKTRAQFDVEHQIYLKERADPRIKAYQKAQRTNDARKRYFETQQRVREAMAKEASSSHRSQAKGPFELPDSVTSAFTFLKGAFNKKGATKSAPSRSSTRLSIVEISVTMRDALKGVRKTVEVAEPEGARKLSVSVPAGTRTGNVLRFRDKRGSGDEIVCIVRVAHHPFISIEAKGVVVEIPITVQEASGGASVTLPTFDDPVVVKIPAGSQSGTELRIKGKGVLGREGERGDLFYKLLIHLPEANSAVGYSDKIKEIEAYYSNSVRASLPSSLLTAS